MKKYLVFLGDTYYPCGGFYDFKGSFDTIDEAHKRIKEDTGNWWQIVEYSTFKLVESGGFK